MQDYNVVPRFNSEEKLGNVKWFAQYTGIGIHKCYEILKTNNAPVIHVGKRIYVIKSQVDEWLDSLIGGKF